MKVSADGLLQIQPRILRCEGGAWMAVSEAGAALPIGVVAQTPESARLRFTEALRSWVVLLVDEAQSEPK